MWYAVVMACNITIGCFVFSDTKGPYNTFNECKTRVQEMYQFLLETKPDIPFLWELNCSQDGSPKTQNSQLTTSYDLSYNRSV